MKICVMRKLSAFFALVMVVVNADVLLCAETSQKINICVISTTDDPKLIRPSEIAAGVLVGTLAKSKSVEVVEREQIELIKREQGINDSQLQNPETAAKIGRIIGCQYAALISLVNAGYPIISVRVIENTTSLTVFSATEAAESPESTSMTAAVSRLADEVLKFFAGEQAVIAEINGKDIIINRGASSGVRQGNFYRVYIGAGRNSVNMAVIRVK